VISITGKLVKNRESHSKIFYGCIRGVTRVGKVEHSPGAPRFRGRKIQ